MSLLEILQLIGYSTAAALAFWMSALLWRREGALSKIERVLFAMALGMGLWHSGNLLITLHAMLGLDQRRWTSLLKFADTLAVISITFTYSLLLHVHLHLWARASSRPLTRFERARVYLSYIPTIFLLLAVPPLWIGPYAPMLEKLSHLTLPFALWAAYVLGLVATTDFLIARSSTDTGEKRLMRALGLSFVAICVLILAVYAFSVGKGGVFGAYLQTVANLGSLLPMALLAYHIYRYHYLELIIKESLIYATFAAVVLVAYLYGIRTIGAWITERFDLRAGAIETLLILSLAFIASPLRIWLDQRFHKLFEREAALYRDVLARIREHGGRYQQLPDLLRFVAERTTKELNLRRVSFALVAPNPVESDKAGGVVFDSSLGDQLPDRLRGEVDDTIGTHSSEFGDELRDSIDSKLLSQAERERSGGLAQWQKELLNISREQNWEPLEGHKFLREHGFEIAYPLHREQKEIGIMLIDAEGDALTYDVRGMLGILAGQVAIAVEDCRLVEENVKLEKQLAHREHLAALGQMAATVAHEVKNPLSAIKSIAQVMREDERIREEYARDLQLIVSEANRLNGSVTQMLNFARRNNTAPNAASTHYADELISNVIELSRIEASIRKVNIESSVEVKIGQAEERLKLDGLRASAIRDSLSNLLLNAIQATPAGGKVAVEARVFEDVLQISVTDTGKGIAPELRERIWEPFFTTKQRGTGLGLAIVRKRMEESGGTATLSTTPNQQGARFELGLPLENGHT